MNTINCPRCNLKFIGEEYRNHKCKDHIKGVKTLPISFYYEGGFDENGDKILMIKSEDGYLYRGVICKHQFPHNLPTNRDLTWRNTNREDNRTLKQYLY
jgi:hypothetical protein